MNKTFLALIVLIAQSTFAQNNPKWDDTQSKKWPVQCKIVEIKSTLDNSNQPAYFYQCQTNKPRPLIVSLHTWSGDFEQKDTLSWMSIQNDYNYIHPHFRGPNNTFQACGSELVIQDIDDAINYAISHANINLSQIHIIGVSGGGYATLLAYMKTKHRIRTFSAWVPISNIEDWYYESVGRKQKYARDIAQATTGQKFENDDYFFDADEARKRSPYFMETPVSERQNCKLFIYTGIHDGYSGSVPVTQSLRFYNKVVHDFAPDSLNLLISTEEMLRMIESQNTRQMNPTRLRHGDVHFEQKYSDKVQVVVFEGKHEMLPSQVLVPLHIGEK